ncbi:MAG: AMP-binding protein, partial [Actinobacteria bacterium]|nr:AMP-binding protein [Actinomycetota bacterium]
MWLVDRIELALGHQLTLGVLADRLAELHGDRPMVVELADDGSVVLALSFAEAARQVDRWAAGVAARSEPGEAVVLATPNGYEQFLLTLAVSRAGRLPAPVNAHMADAEIAHVVEDSGASLVVRAGSEVDDGTRHGPALDADPRAVAALFYTSGTTGRPKGAQLTHRGLIGGMSTGALLPTPLHRAELVAALPVAHIFGFAIVVGAACAGVPLCYLAHFHPVRVLEAIESRRASAFAGAPAMYRMLLAAGAA